MGDWPSAELFSVHVARDGDTTTVVLTGEIDVAAEEAVNAAMVDALHEASARRMLVDLRAVTFIDSRGLTAAIVRPATAAADAGIEFKTIPGAGVARALKVSGLDRFVDPG